MSTYTDGTQETYAHIAAGMHQTFPHPAEQISDASGWWADVFDDWNYGGWAQFIADGSYS